MPAQPTEPPGDGICVAEGHGLKIHVTHGHLIVHDGRGRDRRERRYNRATSKLKRLIVLGDSGYITLDALQWLRDTGAAVIQINRDGDLIAISATAGTDRPALRRAQATAATGPAGIEFTRWILTEKLHGQATVLTEIPNSEHAARTVQRMIATIERADAIPEMLSAEAQAASAYWNAWAGVSAKFAASARVPEHWRTVAQRHSPLSDSPRIAANPANAILNYLHAIIEAEITIACHTIGLDPGLGIFHVDRPGRASMTLDLIEAIRPIADAYLLALLTKRTLRTEDFVETARGSCRILRPLARHLAATSTTWATHAGPIVETACQSLTSHADAPVDVPTALSHTNRARAWDQRRTRAASTRTAAVELPATCRDCGAALPTRRHRYCPPCRKTRFHTSAPDGRAIAATVLAQLRQNGQDPAHGGHAAVIRGHKNAEHQRAVRDWTGEQPDPTTFAAEILPELRDLPIRELVAATGLSDHYCSLIRLGKKTPHARHWDALRNATDKATAGATIVRPTTPNVPTGRTPVLV